MAYMYKRKGNWRLEICKDGKRKDMNLGPDLAQAKVLKGSIEQVCQNEKFKKNLVATLMELGFLDKNLSVTSDEKYVTWEYAQQQLLEHLRKVGRAEKTLESYRYMFSSLTKVLKPAKPSDISTQKADRWVEALINTPHPQDKTGQKKIRPTTVSVFVRTAKAAFQRFVRWQYLDKNPFKACEMPKVEFCYPRSLSPDELDLLLKASNDPLKRCIRILVESGMRPNEFYNLPWRRVIEDGANSYIHITKDGNWKPKAYTERMIFITPELRVALGKRGLLEELVAGRNEQGFPVNKDWLTRSFARAVKRAGLSGRKITIYCCRDTYATNLALQGHEAHVIAARLGHRDISTSMHYVSLARLNTAQLKVNKKIA